MTAYYSSVFASPRPDMSRDEGVTAEGADGPSYEKARTNR